MFRFSIRELMLVVVVVAMGLAWWLDHRAIHQKYTLCVEHLNRMRFVLWDAKDALEAASKWHEDMPMGSLGYMEPDWKTAFYPSNRETLFPSPSNEKQLQEIERHEREYPPSSPLSP